MRIRILIAAALAAVSVSLSVAQQPLLPPALVAYSCSFVRSANEVRIAAVLQGADARPLTDSAIDLSAQQRGNPSPLEVAFETVPDRPPLRLVIVLDLTDTVPLVELSAVIEQDLLENLLPEDEVALITFSEDIAPVTPFVADKQAFVLSDGSRHQFRRQSALRCDRPGDRRVSVCRGDSSRSIGSHR